MARLAVRIILAGLFLYSGFAFAQGSFAHFAYSAGYQTSFTLVNLSTTESANVNLFFYNSDGTSLQADVQGVGPVTPYSFTIPAGGSKTVVLLGDPAAAKDVEGWAQLAVVGNYPTVRGQASFKRHLATVLNDFEAVVPLTTSGPVCIEPFPPQTPGALIPFDNTNGYLTALAFANTGSVTQTLQLEYDDESYNKIATSTLSLDPNKHVAFVTYAAGAGSDPAVAGKKGVLRIQATTADFAVLGLSFNPTGPFTAILPITQ